MDAWVQLIRNAMCCIKDWNLWSDTWLYDAKILQHYLDRVLLLLLPLPPPLPPPLNQTTPLEAAISLSQLYACYSITKSGYKLIQSSLRQLHYLKQPSQQPPPPAPPAPAPTSTSTSTQSSSSSSTSTSSSTSPSTPILVTADRLVRQGLIQARGMAWRNLIIGANVLPIGIAFFWLFANSWHVTSTPWIGGLQGVIHALTVMEVCLIPLLCDMLWNAYDKLTATMTTTTTMMTTTNNNNNNNNYQFLPIAARLSNTATNSTTTMTTTTGNILHDVTLKAFQVMANSSSSSNINNNNNKWKPYYEEEESDGATFTTIAAAARDNVVSSSTTKESNKSLFEKEVERVQHILETFIDVHDDNDDKKVAIDDGEKQDKIRQTARRQAAEQLLYHARKLSLEGYRECIYFVLNFIAFYGYFLGVLCYYYTHDHTKTTTTTTTTSANTTTFWIDHLSWYVRNLKFGMSHADADWHGNFAGDLMWTIEPIIILASPRVMDWMLLNNHNHNNHINNTTKNNNNITKNGATTTRDDDDEDNKKKVKSE